MSKMISARVPDALYEQASTQLSSLGFNTSDLVNAAFEYVLKEKTLPKTACAHSSKKRSLTEQQTAHLANVFRKCTLGISIPDNIAHDKQVARSRRVEKYENPA